MKRLDHMNLGAPSQLTMSERHDYRVFGTDIEQRRWLLNNMFAAPRVAQNGVASARGMHLSRLEKNRLAHAENGNTMTPRSERTHGPSAYMSNKSRNRLAHATNGNTARQQTPQELYDALVKVPVQEHRCKGRTYTLSQCSRKPLEGSAFCAQHARTLKHGRVENPVPRGLREQFLNSGYKLLQPEEFQWYSRRRMWHFAEERGKSCVEDLDDNEFLAGLAMVNEYFKHHIAQRVYWNLTPKQGPQSLEDRCDESKLNYLGEPMVYK